MAQKLLKYYEDAAKMGGLKAKMRLALKTKISNAKAKDAPDSPTVIQTFEKAFQEIRKEFN